jgi:hypothetical protein
MNKKLIRALIASTLLAYNLIQVSPMAQANQAPTVAILDTALDTSLPIFKDRIVFEVCILEWNSCPNGTNFMDGPGSATLPISILNNGRGFDHGTGVSSVVVNTDPNVKIVFVRIIGNTAYGQRQAATEITVNNALSWVLTNKDKYNIKSIAMSQGHHSLGPIGTEYCPSTPDTKNLITSLVNEGVATFFPAGNSRDHARLDWPACIQESISVGWSDEYEKISLNSNFDKNNLDFYALGNIMVSVPGGSTRYVGGSSISVQVAATKWAILKSKYPAYSQQQLIDLLSQTSRQIHGSKGQFGKLINLDAAIKLAESEYQSELKASLDKFNAIKADWDKK